MAWLTRNNKAQRISKLRTLGPGARVHISGVCGTGMAALATLCKEKGFIVSGSDKAFYPPMGDIVRDVVHEIYEGFCAKNLSNRPDVVIIGNSIRSDNPEAQAVMELEIPFASFPEALQAWLIGTRDECSQSVVICGTHGKTSTSAMTTTLLDVAGLKPGYFIGGVPLGLEKNIRPVDLSLPLEKRAVVLEGDEYDSAFFAKEPKFLSYRPDVAVVTSLEFDYADIYLSRQEIERQFAALVKSLPDSSRLIVWGDDNQLSGEASSWVHEAGADIDLIFYGEGPTNAMRLVERIPRSLPGGGLGQDLVFMLGKERLNVQSATSGLHNALNLLAAASVGHVLGLSSETISRGLAAYRGVKRRQEILGKLNGAVLIDDFAHHPTAVATTLAGIKESYPGKRLIAVFEPRSNTSRRHFFQREYAQALAIADVSLIKEIEDAGNYDKAGRDIESLNVCHIVQDLVGQGRDAHSFADVGQIAEFLKRETNSDDVVVIMSNGDFGGIKGILGKSSF